MNILYRGCASKRGYQSRILRELYKKGIFTKCTIVTQSLDDRDKYPKNIYHEIPAHIGYATKYNNICDMDAIPEPSEELLRELRQYENEAFNMTCRNYHMHIMHFDEMAREYWQHVKFWNWVLEEDKIDFVFLTTTPHHVWEYIIYALAKVKKIPVLIISVANVPGLNEVGTSLDNLGKNTSICYEKMLACDMDENVQNFYDRVLTQKAYMPIKEREKNLNRQKKWVYNTYHRRLVNQVIKNEAIWKDIIEKRTKDKLRKDWAIYKNNISMILRIVGGSLNQRDARYYNKVVAQAVNYNKKYIYYALQYFPESSVLPRAGVFWNQLLAIKMLAKVGKKYDVAVYVKEHWIEEARTKAFYDELTHIDNVYRVSTGEDTYKIIEHAIAVSSMTGTCMNESIIKGKPVITFANHCLCGAPGVFRVGSEEEVEQALKDILSPKFEVNAEEVKRYYSAMSKTLVKGYLDWPEKPEYDLRDCIKETVQVIEAFVRDGMKEDFCYIKE